LIRALILLSVLTCALPATAVDLTGQATVIDGDTLDIRGQRIQLYGIGAPESGQMCKTAAGADYRCGQISAFTLTNFIARRLVRRSQRDADRYGRIFAVCYAGAINLGAAMVANGWALAYREYSTDYVGEEQEAREARRGVWRGVFGPPWEWRKGDR
jgi:endonuclease YncB( thermonuclease family)